MFNCVYACALQNFYGSQKRASPETGSNRQIKSCHVHAGSKPVISEREVNVLNH